MRRAVFRAAAASILFAACGGIVEVPGTEAGAGGSGGAPDAGVPPPSQCRQFSTQSDCCRAEKGTACMWIAPEGDFQGGCIGDEEDCGQPLNVCPPGQRCYTKYGPGGRGDCHTFDYSESLFGMCVDE